MESIDDIVRDMRAYDSGEIADVWIHIFADRIEAAWKAKLAQEMEFAYSSGAMDGKAYSQKVRRNCDRFTNREEAYSAYSSEHADLTMLDWLFSTVKEEESK